MEVHHPKFVKGLIAEIFVIVISISLAVGAERLVENWIHENEGKESLKRFRTELVRDSIDFEININTHLESIRNDSILYEWSKFNIELTDDSVGYTAAYTLNSTIFQSNASEFESMKGSNKLSFIKNHELLSRIITNYDRYEDFDSFTQSSHKIQANLLILYKNNSYIFANKPFEGPFYRLDGNLIRKNLRGNQLFENSLQEKKHSDQWMVFVNKSALERVKSILELIDKEEL